MIEINEKKQTELCKSILKLLKAEDTLPSEAFGILEAVRMAYIAAILELEMKTRFGLTRVKE